MTSTPFAAPARARPLREQPADSPRRDRPARPRFELLDVIACLNAPPHLVRHRPAPSCEDQPNHPPRLLGLPLDSAFTLSLGLPFGHSLAEVLLRERAGDEPGRRRHDLL